MPPTPPTPSRTEPPPGVPPCPYPHTPSIPPSAEHRAAEAGRRAAAALHAALLQAAPSIPAAGYLCALGRAASEAAGYAAYAQSPEADAAYADWAENRAAEAEHLAAELAAELAKLG